MTDRIPTDLTKREKWLQKTSTAVCHSDIRLRRLGLLIVEIRRLDALVAKLADHHCHQSCWDDGALMCWEQSECPKPETCEDHWVRVLRGKDG